MEKEKRLKVVFIGQNSKFACLPLLNIINYHDVIGIVESGPRIFSKGIKHIIKRFLDIKISKYSLYKYARKNRIPYFFLLKHNQNDLIDFLNKLNPDVICVASMSQLLKKEIIDIPRYGVINFHPSLLPKYRGPNPWFWQYYHMEEKGGVTIHFIDEGEDTGDIIKQESYEINLGDSLEKTMEKAIRIGAKLMVDALADIANGNVTRIPQKHLPCPFRARNISLKEPLLDWQDWEIERAWHFLRGTSKWSLAKLPMSKIFRWEVGEIEKCFLGNTQCFASYNVNNKSLYNIIGFDCKGFFIKHFDGKIRLKFKLKYKLK